MSRILCVAAALLVFVLDPRGLDLVWSKPVGWGLVALAGGAFYAGLRGRREGTLGALVVVAIGAVLASGAAVAIDVRAFAVVELLVRAFLLALLAEGWKKRDDTFSPFSLVPLLGAFFLVVDRVLFVGGTLVRPRELGWSENPFLTNMLKLDAGAPLYGPPEDLNSYPYAPLLELVHFAILRPLHLELSLFANRLVVVFEQAIACVLLWIACRALRPAMARGEMWLLLAIVALSFSNMLAPIVHPDHGVLLCVAVALVVFLRERTSPWWWAALVLVTPIATGFKLSAAGIGVGLVSVYALEKRVRVLAALAGSAAIAIACIPLFNATLGRFSEYAIGLMGSHPLQWARLFTSPPWHYIAAIACPLLAVASMKSPSKSLRRLLVFAIAPCIASLFAYVKIAGNENNLHVPLVLATLAILFASSEPREGPRLHALLAPTLVCHSLLVIRQPPPPPATLSVAPRSEREDFDAIVAAIHQDESTLLLTDTVAWIRAGRRDVPRDRFFAAYELFCGNRPEAHLLSEHVRDRRYRTIVVGNGWTLRASSTLIGRYAGEISDALDQAGYTIVYPPGAKRAQDAANGAVIFRLPQ